MHCRYRRRPLGPSLAGPAAARAEFGTYSIGYTRYLWVIEKIAAAMYVDEPSGAYDRLLVFSTPRRDLLRSNPSRTAEACRSGGGLVPKSSCRRQNLARVHDVQRIERLLDGAHDVDAVAELVAQEADLALADAVLAGAGAFHGNRAHVEPGDEFFGERDFLRIVDVHQHQHMEIAVAGMADDRRDQAHFGDVGLGFGDAFGEPRNRHADIGRKPLGAGTQRQRRPVGVVPRLPELRPLLRDAGPPKRSPGLFLGDHAEGLGLFGDAGVAAVEFDEQARALRIVELRIILHRPHLQRVDQFDACHRNAHLDGRDHRVAGGLKAGERTDAAADRLWNALQPERQRRDDAERAFRTDQQPGQVIAGRAFLRPLAGRHHF